MKFDIWVRTRREEGGGRRREGEGGRNPVEVGDERVSLRVKVESINY